MNIFSYCVMQHDSYRENTDPTKTVMKALYFNTDCIQHCY